MSIIRNILKSKSNERLRQLIEAIRTRDFSLQYSLNHLKGEERKLAQQINEVVNEFRETTLRQEAKYQYFGTMLDTINDLPDCGRRKRCSALDEQGGC